MDLTVVIAEITPVVDDGRWAAKRVQGDEVVVEATVFAGGGNSEVEAEVEITAPDGTVRTVPMAPTNPGLDRWAASFTVSDLGVHRYRVIAWVDRLKFHRRRVLAKRHNGRDSRDELDGLLTLASSLESTAGSLTEARALLAEGSVAARLGACFSLVDLLTPVTAELRAFTTKSPSYQVVVDLPIAQAGAWYQFFPRSEGAGTLRDAITALDRVAEMGFSVVYLPPIHPIGLSHRKGPDDTEHAGPSDPGSPWAIGSEDGGHDAIHPDLGTERDLVDLLARGRELGIEIALDYALNFSPDHPWVREHPEWFIRRADGSFIPAGTADKYYQDIYTLDFNGPYAESIAAACRAVLDHWLDLGVWLFRVDLPHTKPLWFWERTIAEVKAERPHVVFFAEAFTKPTMMHWMSKAGFSQSLTYFLWRDGKYELEEFFAEIHAEGQRQYLRPNVFVNSHDHLPPYLRDGGHAAFALRAGLAGLGSPTWGVYSGYELLENTARTPQGTKYAGSEIYQVVRRDWTAPPLAPWIATLNRIRRDHPVVRDLGNLRRHWIDDDAMLAFSRVGDEEAVLVVANLDTGSARESTLHLSTADLGWSWADAFTVVDELTGEHHKWYGDRHHVRVDPYDTPVRVFSIRR